MNGDITTYNLNAPMDWATFKSMSVDLQKEYVNGLIQKYNVSNKMLAFMFGVSNWTVWDYIKNTLGITGKRKRMTSSDIIAWTEFISPFKDAILRSFRSYGEKSPDGRHSENSKNSDKRKRKCYVEELGEEYGFIITENMHKALDDFVPIEIYGSNKDNLEINKSYHSDVLIRNSRTLIELIAHMNGSEEDLISAIKYFLIVNDVLDFGVDYLSAGLELKIPDLRKKYGFGNAKKYDSEEEHNNISPKMHMDSVSFSFSGKLSATAIYNSIKMALADNPEGCVHVEMRFGSEAM